MTKNASSSSSPSLNKRTYSLERDLTHSFSLEDSNRARMKQKINKL